jgi:hypothetical protein
VSAPYRPGQSQWPENRPQRPDRPPPIQFRQDDPGPPPRNKTLEWGLRIAGLVVVAVVSGLVWYYIINDNTSSTANGGDPGGQQSDGVYQFSPHQDMPNEDTQDTCPTHAYGDTKQFLEGTKCERLTRQLYVAKVDGRTVYTSVSVVTMADGAAADELRQLTDKNGSGNVSDVVRDKLVTIPGLEALNSGGYAASQSDRNVIIVESEFDPKDATSDEKADEDILDSVSTDALRLGTELAASSG